MKFTPGQLRQILDLSPEGFRHWKKVLPPLAGHNGYRPCFSPGDLLAVAIVKSLTEELGIRVSVLVPIALPLFELCNRSPWAALERAAISLDLISRRIASTPELEGVRAATTAIVVPCRPIIKRLRHRLLLGNQDEPQPSLPFPPTAIANEPLSRGAFESEGERLSRPQAVRSP